MEIETVERLAEIISQHPIAEIDVTDGESRVRLTRGLAASRGVIDAGSTETVETPAEPYGFAAMEVDDEESSTIAVTAELVGLFHHASPPVHHGTPVREGEVIGSIEAMKLMNDVKAPAAGRIAEVMIEENAPVGYGQPLFGIDLA